jgi:hypothetical protein
VVLICDLRVFKRIVSMAIVCVAELRLISSNEVANEIPRFFTLALDWLRNHCSRFAS